MLQVWTKGRLSSKCTKDVPKGRWYIDKINAQNMQLMQASELKMSTDDDWSTITGSTPATQGSSSQGASIQEGIRPIWQCL